MMGYEKQSWEYEPNTPFDIEERAHDRTISKLREADAELARLREVNAALMEDAHAAVAESRKLREQVAALVAACETAGHRFAMQNGLVSAEVWNGNYEAVSAIISALALARKEADRG